MSHGKRGSEDPSNSSLDAQDIYFGGYQYDEKRKCLVTASGDVENLRAQSLAVFVELAAHRDTVVSKDQLTHKVWPNVHVTDDSIGKCVSDIRKALGDSTHKVLRTIPRQGYMLVSDEIVNGQVIPTQENTSGITKGLTAVLAIAAVGVLSLGFVYKKSTNDAEVVEATIIEGTPSVNLVDGSSESTNELVSTLLPELRVSLSRYRTLELSDSESADYTIVVSEASDERLSVELKNDTSGPVWYTHRVTTNLSTQMRFNKHTGLRHRLRLQALERLIGSY